MSQRVYEALKLPLKSEFDLTIVRLLQTAETDLQNLLGFNVVTVTSRR